MTDGYVDTVGTETDKRLSKNLRTEKERRSFGTKRIESRSDRTDYYKSTITSLVHEIKPDTDRTQ